MDIQATAPKQLGDCRELINLPKAFKEKVTFGNLQG